MNADGFSARRITQGGAGARLRMCLGICLLLTVNSLAAAGAVYQWTDEHGRVHFSDRPLPGKAQKLDLPKVERAPDADLEQRRQKRKRLLEAFAKERRVKKAAAAEKTRLEQKRRKNCQRARRELEDYQRAGLLYQVDGEGQKVYLSDEQRAHAIEKAREAVAHWCN